MRCSHCGYSLIGLASAQVCPECGGSGRDVDTLESLRKQHLQAIAAFGVALVLLPFVTVGVGFIHIWLALVAAITSVLILAACCEKVVRAHGRITPQTNRANQALMFCGFVLLSWILYLAGCFVALLIIVTLQ